MRFKRTKRYSGKLCFEDLMVICENAYKKDGFRRWIGQYMILNRLSEGLLSIDALAEKQALFNLIKTIPPDKLEQHLNSFVDKLNKTTNPKKRYKLVEKIDWITYFQFFGESRPGEPLPKRFPTIYDLGEKLYPLVKTYLIGKMRKDDPFFLDNLEYSLETQIESDIKYWEDELAKEGFRGPQLVESVVNQVLDFYRDRITIPEIGLQQGFVNHVYNTQPRLIQKI